MRNFAAATIRMGWRIAVPRPLQGALSPPRRGALLGQGLVFRAFNNKNMQLKLLLRPMGKTVGRLQKSTMMKKLIGKWFYGCALVVCGLCASVALASCGDDDEDGGSGGPGGGGDGSGNVSAYFEVDGERYNFSYAYVAYDGYDDPTASISLFNVDLMYYYTHPEEVRQGMYFSDCYVDLAGSEIPTGTLTSCVDGADNKLLDLEMSTKTDLYSIIVNGYDDSDTQWYGLDWMVNSEMQVAKTGANSYRMEAGDLNMLCGDPGEGDGGIDVYSRKAKAKFYFNGSLTDIAGMNGGTRVVVVERGSDFAKFLQSLRQRH